MLFYTIEQHIHQGKMKQILELESTVPDTISISKELFDKSKRGNHEILVEGILYDMKSFSFQGNSVILLVIRDREEEAIVNATQKAMDTENQHGKGLLVKIVSLLSLDYTPPPIALHTAPIPAGQNVLSVYQDLILMGNPDIITPPPKFS
jgi:hypothetical protein